MGLTDRNNIIEELLVDLRNNLTDPKGRPITGQTDEFNGTGAQTQFTLTKGAAVKNVSAVTIGGSPQTLFTDYTVNYSTGIVTFAVAPTGGTDNVDITYDHGTTWIVPGFPRNDLRIGDYPLIGFNISTNNKSAGIGGAGNYVKADLILLQIIGRNTKEVRELMDDVENRITTNRKGYLNFPYIELLRESEILPLANRSDKAVSVSMDFIIPLRFESL